MDSKANFSDKETKKQSPFLNGKFEIANFHKHFCSEISVTSTQRPYPKLLNVLRVASAGTKKNVLVLFSFF